MKALKNGLLTGLTLQLAIGPVFFFITNLALQKSLFDGLAGVLAVTTVDYLYITLSILGIGKLLENKRIKKIFGIVSSVVLAIFGALILKGVLTASISSNAVVGTSNIISSFIAVFLITISSPMTIVFFTSLFATKAIEYNYTKKELVMFGLGTGGATLLFMGTSVILFSLIRGAVPLLLMVALNGIVGCLLIGYGIKRLVNLLRKNKKILVFTEGTILMPASGKGKNREEVVQLVKDEEESVHDFKSYVPIENAVQKIKEWLDKGAEIFYLTSRRTPEEIIDIKNVLKNNNFPECPLLFRKEGEDYKDVAEKLMPDVIVEDDCESIGGEVEMTYPHIKSELKIKIKTMPVPEFGGIDHLPKDL